MASSPYNVLFLCTGNSARSLMAECALGRWGGGRFRAFSAGSQPKDAPHPQTLRLLRALNYDVSKLRSKSWDEFAQPGAAELHFVFTLCDDARGETCPVWPGQPLTAHWGTADPAAASADRVEREFRRAHGEIENRIKIFASLPLEALDRITLAARLEAIGKGDPDSI